MGRDEPSRRPRHLRIYEALLVIFPLPFRERYGREIARLFDDRYREARSRGTRRSLWIATVWDVIRNGLLERVQHHCARRKSVRRGKEKVMGVAVRHLINGHDRRTVMVSVRQWLSSLSRRPGITIASVAAIAAGVGVNAAVLTFVSSVLLEPLPYETPERLVMVWGREERVGLTREGASPANYHDWETQNIVFESMGAYVEVFLNLEPDDGHVAERLFGFKATPSFLQTLGVHPIVGRSLVAEDLNNSAELGVMFPEGRDEPMSILISHRLWQRRFGSDIGVLGRGIMLSGGRAVIVGVLPRGFFFLNKEIDIVAPLAFSMEQIRNWRSPRYLTVVARLKPGIALASAHAEMETIAGRLQELYPDANEGLTIDLRRLDEETFGALSPRLLLLQGASLFVLLIAAANVSNLQLARAVSRSREFATRAVLGCSRRGLFRELLSESLLLGIVGGILGIAAAAPTTRLLGTAVPFDIPRLDGAQTDSRVLMGSFALAVLASLAFGFAPALFASRVELSDSLSEGSRSSSSKSTGRVQRLLVTVEIGVALVLLVGAGLTLKSIASLQRVDPGFSSRDDALTVDLSLPRWNGEAAFFEELLERVQSLPTVDSAGVTSHLPFSGEVGDRYYTFVGRESLGPEYKLNAEFRRVSVGYFDAMGIPLQGGRLFTPWDMRESSAGVVIVNEALAREHWGREEEILGKQLIIEDGPPRAREVIGVVGNVKHFGLHMPARPELYVPHVDRPWPHMTLVVRARDSGSRQLLEQIRHELSSLDRNVPASNIQTMKQRIAASTRGRRLSTGLLVSYAIVALFLAALGVYGAMAHSVRQRRKEIGIRLTVGAEGRHVRGLILRDGLRTVAVGLAIGSAAAAALTRLAADLLYAVDAFDTSVLLTGATLLGVIAVLACYIPARYASKQDVMTSLRA